MLQPDVIRYHHADNKSSGTKVMRWPCTRTCRPHRDVAAAQDSLALSCPHIQCLRSKHGKITPDSLFAIVPGIPLNVRLDLGIAEYRPRSWVQEVSMQGIPLI